MDEKLLSALALAAISGLTYVAYKHPSGYMRLLKTLGVVGPAIFFGALIWDIGTSTTYFRLYDFIDPTKRDAARAAIDGASLINGRIVAGYIGLGLYLCFLAFLPEILGEQEPPKEKGE